MPEVALSDCPKPRVVASHCAHCQDALPQRPILYQNKSFCCQGCQTVFALLHENGLTDFYARDPQAGKRVKETTIDRWAFLELEEVKQSLLEYSDKAFSRITLALPDIHCSSCIWLLEHLHKINPAIRQSAVNFPRKTLSVYWKHEALSLRALVELLSKLGYSPDIRLDKQEKTPQKGNRSLVIRVGVTGFCFGNIMLLSLPEYLDTTSLLESNYRQYFLWLNLVLSLPVLFYSAQEFFRSAWAGLRHRFINMDVPIALGILVLFGRSVYEITSASGAGYLDSLAGLVFFLLIGRWYQSKTYQALSFDRDYQSYFPVAATRLSEGKEETILLKELAPGDRLLIRHGELIPADSILLKGEGQIDYAFVTGESEPQASFSGDKLFAGGRQMGGPLEITLQKEVAQSYLTQLWNQQPNEKPQFPAMGNLAGTTGRWFTIVILLLSAATALYWAREDAGRVWQTVTAVLIVACPCALALSVPFTYGNALRAFGKKGLYLKNADTVEALAEIDTLVFDKTGTITHKEGSQLSDKLQTTEVQRQAIASLCRASTHPLSQQLYHYLKQDVLPAVSGFQEITGQGIEGVVDGMCYRIGAASFAQGEQTEETRVWVSCNGSSLGYIAFASQFRQGLFASLKKLRRNFGLHLLSGDSERDRPALENYFAALHFRQQPKEKLAYVNQLKQEGKQVMMLGDGLNDAGALGASRVGVSVSDDVYQFSPACDAILAADQVQNLPKLLRLARRSKRVVYGAFALSLAYNAVGISFAVAGLLTPLVSAILMPLSSVTVVAFCSLAIKLSDREEDNECLI